MRTRLSFALVVVCAAPVAAQTTVVTFENPTLAQPLPGPNTFQNGSTLSPPGSFTTLGTTFNNSYNAAFDSWSGWSYSNVTNVTTPGFANQYAAYNVPGGGTGAAGSANYAVAFGFPGGGGFPADPITVALPAGMLPQSARITNTTYAALSMRDGDQFAKKFGGPSGNDPDFFRLTIRGLNAQNQATGTVEFFLADYRFSDNSLDYILNQWATVDLTPLGVNTTTLSFSLDSSDVGPFGMNTPAYFAFDNLVLVPIPEPAAVGLAAAAGLLAARTTRRRVH
jgi:hypothetical protein